MQTGEVVKMGNGTADEVEKPSGRDASMGVAAVAAGGAAVVAGGAAVAAGGAGAGADSEKRIAAGPDVEKQQVSDGPQIMETEAPTQSHPGTQDQAVTGGVEQGVSELALSPPPTASTAPGKPEGDVVFDHAPSQGEIRQAKESLDQDR